jgi:hypothetical protein
MINHQPRLPYAEGSLAHMIEGKDEGISVGGRSICAAITKYLDEVMYKQQNFISQSLEA